MKKFPVFLLTIIYVSLSAVSAPMKEYKDTPRADVVKHFDVIVIGAGAGTKLVRPVANKGLKVAVIEREKLGGTCLNKGCIPSKMLIHVADVVTQIKGAGKFYLTMGELHIAFEQLMQYVTQVIDQESAQIEPVYKSDHNITFYHEHAAFLTDHIVQVGSEYITAPKIFIATGVDIKIPPIPGLEYVPYMTYREALRNIKLPAKLLVIGGGYIAAELGYFYGTMGSETHFFVRDRMLSREDFEIREEFESAFAQQFHLHRHTQIKNVGYEEGVYTLMYEDESGAIHSIEGDGLLIATGMSPLTKHLGLEHTGIRVDEEGYILVDDTLQTTVEGVFAFGDCIGRYGFRHSANYEGEYLFKNLFESSHSVPIVYKPMPHAIFTHPQIASVGKTEDQLQKEGISYIKGICRYKQSAMGMALKADIGFVKLLFDRSSRKLLGAHIIGEEASNMIHMLIAFMYKDATVEDIAGMIYVHPALPEVVRNAARHAR